MKLTKEQFMQILKEEAEKIAIELNAEKLEKFYLYKQILLEYNEKINLTAITEDDEIIFKHFIDCMNIIKHIKENENVIDVGTGAGFPGIVIAICLPNIKILLLDSLNKRIEFSNTVKEELKLDNVITIHARAEVEVNSLRSREKFDIVTARAVAPLNILLEYLTGFAKVKGKLIIMKGKNINDELENSKKAESLLNLKKLTIEKYIINTNTEEIIHNNIVYEKLDKTSKSYPRTYLKMKKNPL